MRYSNLLLGVLFLFFCSSSKGQERKDSLVSGDFKGLTIEQFILQLEAQTPFHFYYDQKQFDSLQITLSVKGQPLQKVLELAFVNTNFHYSIDQHDNVFLIKDKMIRTDLPAGFFGSSRNINDSAITNTNTADIGLTSDSSTISASLENKLYEIGTKSQIRTGNSTVAGYVRDDKTHEPLPGVSIYLEENPGIGTVTDQFGFFSLTLPRGLHTLNIQSRGKRDVRRHILVYANGKIDIYLHDQIISLREVIISSRKTSNVRSVQLGVENLNISTIKTIPTIFGEADISRALLVLPGVKSVGEASTGFNVRGGATDQNLILFNGTTVYNPSHFFGFFSAFNPEVIKDVELYKSSIPAKYGGRLSSVLDITSKEGNKKNYAGSAGIGPVTSRLNVEGPIFKDSSSSFVLGARATYADWLLKLLPKQYERSKASFYDVVLHTTHEMNKKNSLYLTAYLSNDHFNLNNDTAYEYSNRNFCVQWKHTFNNKLNNLVSGGYDFYKYDINSEANKINAYDLQFNINQASVKSDFNYYINAKHTVQFGLNSIFYKLNPGSYRPLGSESLVKTDIIPSEQALESALYCGDRYNLTPDFSIDYALRYSFFQYLGPQTVSTYAPGLPKEESSRIGNKEYGRGSVIKTYSGPEYRFAFRYSLTSDFSIKAGFNSLRQYIHMLSNTTAIAPTDIWKLSDPNIKPQEGNQISFGMYKNFKSNTIETSVEVYYKRMEHYLDYKSGAILVLNHNIETDVINTKGKAYGVELLIKKTAGKLNGWLSYTYSRTLLKMDDPLAGEVINHGQYYPSNYDKPHDVSFVGNLKLSHRFSISTNIAYSTGRPITLPVGRYTYAGSQRVLYSDRNAYRIPDNFRVDFSMNIEGNHKVQQKTHNSWTIGAYNLTGRKNPYSVYFISENGLIKGYKLSIFGSIIPFVNFNIRF